MAAKHGLFGEVDNRTDGVSITVQGDFETVDLFGSDILHNAPPASQVKSIEINPKKITAYTSFKITPSKIINDQITEISPDIAVCDECLEDMEKDPARIGYPFVNCTNCGPRFTIIEELPYDRPNTTMKSFIMCENCCSEYDDISDRRFHAQPIACNSCGPVYLFKDSIKILNDITLILNEVQDLVTAGKTIAIKGLGGYHLLCDALNNNAVLALRERKQRDSKPFAVMFRDIASARIYCHIDEVEENELRSWRRPIVILKQSKVLSEAINNGLDTIGAMLPYMPFHYMLFRKLTTSAVVLTSGNISDEPVIIDDLKAEEQLMPVAGSLLSYNRVIFNRTDDSVERIINNKPVIIRRSRGFVPRPVDLKQNAEGILALGAEQKNTFCIGKGNQAVMSQYIGDLKNQETYNFFCETVDRFSDLFRFNPELIACDLHPQYLSTHYARLFENELNIPVVRVQHHHAHIASCMAEYGLNGSVIGISLDGTGLGSDGNIWGGEFLIAGLNDFTRFSHFDYVPMPGGDKAINEPWRMAYSYLFKYFGDNFDYNSIPVFRSVDVEKQSIVREMIIKKINAPVTSGAGRLFDAVSAILQLCTIATFDSEAPMRLESVIACETNEFYPFQAGPSVVFADTLKAIINDIPKNNISLISAKFHNTVAQVILEVAEQIRKETSLDNVVLSGGVFQNKYLLEKSITLLSSGYFNVYTNQLVPVNDGGLSLGQLVIASNKRR